MVSRARSLFLSLAQFASGIVGEWELYLVTQFIWGVGWTFISGAEVAWVTDEIGDVETVERLLLRRGRLELVAIVIGVMVFAVLSLVVSLAVCVMVAGASGFAWTAFLAFAMSERNFVPEQNQRIEAFTRTLRIGASHVSRRKSLRLLVLALVVAGMGAEALDRLDLRRLEDVGLSVDHSPVLVFSLVIIAKSLFGAAVLWRFEDRMTSHRVVTAFAVAIGIVGIAAIVGAHVSLLAIASVAIVAQGGLLGATRPMIDTWANALAPDEARATVHSFIGQAQALGEILGGITFAVVAGVWTLSVAWTASAGLFFAAVIVALRARRHWSDA